MGKQTEIAIKAIKEEEEQFENYETPEEVLAYIHERSNFKELSLVLKKTMIQAGSAKEGDKDPLFYKTLYQELLKQSSECKTEKVPSLKTVTRWIRGETAAISDRHTVIAICFALKLDLKQTRSFLNQCGFSALSIRNEKDAVYMYCLLNGRSLSCAEKILEEYHNKCGTIKEDLPSAIHSGMTTVSMLKRLENSSWENDAEFLNTFLLVNKDRFIGYTFGAFSEYYRWKNMLWFIVVSDMLSNEMTSLSLLANAGKGPTSPLNDLFPSLQAFSSAAEKCGSDSSYLYPLYRKFHENNADINGLIETLRSLVINADTLSSRKEIDAFFSDIIKAEGLLKRTIECMLGDNGRIRERSESSLFGSVMSDFPIDDTFSDFEKDPSSFSEGLTIRKAIILMYYICYAYEFSNTLMDYTYCSDIFGEIGFMEFIEDLNRVLALCGLPYLDKKDRFDWLILRSIKEFDISDYAEDKGDPIAFFNDVLAYSFPKNEDQ